MKKKKIIVIIPARGGSKGIPKKNIKLLGGKPLIAWPIQLAKSVSRVDRIIVSTDSIEIAEIANKYGAETPFLRPDDLSGDKVPTLPVLQHVVKYLEEKEGYKADIILLLYTTTPFLKKERIEEALDLFESTNCNSVMGAQKVRTLVWKYNRKKAKYQPFYPKNRVNRQYFEPLHKEAGNIYFSRYKVLMEQNQIIDSENIKFIMVGDDETIDIDSIQDLQLAEELLKKIE